MAELQEYETREDTAHYEAYLREVLSLFGQAIHTSLERTMGKYLQSLGGIYRNEARADWELEKVCQLLSHNNAAERPFAIVKVSPYPSPHIYKPIGLTLPHVYRHILWHFLP